MKKKEIKAENNQFLANNFRRRKKIPVMLFVFSFLIGINTLNHSFTLDDEIYYSGNKISQKGIAGMKEMFTRGSTSGFKETGKKDLYRPLVMLSFGIEKDLFNNNPRASHFIQIILYACACVILYSLLNIFFPSHHFLVPLLITLLFASHPVHTEVIASIKSRDELLAFLFSMLSLRQFVLIKKENPANKMLPGLLFLFCGLLSKESAVMMITVIPLTLYYFSSLPGKRIIYITLFSSGVLLLYFLMRIQAIPFSTITLQPNLIDNALMAARTNSQMLATNFVLLGMYFKLLFIPYPLSYDYSFNQVPVVSWNNFFAIAALIIYLLIFIYSIVATKKKNPVAFGILFFLLTLFLASNLIFKIDATIGLRFLFTPVLGFCIAIVFIVYKIFKIDPHKNATMQENKNMIILFSVVISVFTVLSILRNADWKDNFTLFSHDVEVSPNSTRIHSGLGFEYAMKAMQSSSPNQRSEWLKNSINHYKRAVEIYPGHPDAWFNLGVAYFNLGEKENAMQSYWKAAEVNPQLKDPLKELGGIYYNDHRNDSALYYFRRVLTLDSSDEQANSIARYLEGEAN
jgi:protein O-mannosyl-transferase